MHSANGRWRYNVTSFLIGWAHTQNDPCIIIDVIPIFFHYIPTIWHFGSSSNKSPYKLHLTHWGRLMHIYLSNLAMINSDNGLLPGRCQAIIWTNAGILLIQSLGMNLSEISSKIHTFSFKKMHLKMLSGKCQPFCFSLNVLIKVIVLQQGKKSCFIIMYPFIFRRPISMA